MPSRFWQLRNSKLENKIFRVCVKNKIPDIIGDFSQSLMRWLGLEPPRLSAHGPQPCLSASSSTSAQALRIIICLLCLSSNKNRSGDIMTRIVVDAMGSDNFPTPDVQGALMAA